MDTPEQAETRTEEFLLTKILDGLFKADQLIDLIPTRLHTNEDETLARIGRLVNQLPNPRGEDMEESGYRKIRDALICAKELASLRQQLAKPADGIWTSNDIDDRNCKYETLEQFCRDNARLAPFFVMIANALDAKATPDNLKDE